MKLSMNGIEARHITLAAGDGLTAGALCKITAACTAGAAASGEAFVGPVTAVRAGLACVQLGGYCELPYTGSSAPTLGYCKLAADGTGGVTTNASGREYLVVEVDTTGKTVGLFL